MENLLIKKKGHLPCLMVSTQIQCWIKQNFISKKERKMRKETFLRVVFFYSRIKSRNTHSSRESNLQHAKKCVSLHIAHRNSLSFFEASGKTIPISTESIIILAINKIVMSVWGPITL